VGSRTGARFDLADGFGRFNIAPTQEALTVVDEGDGRRGALMRWGLVPHWASDGSGPVMINARSETVHERPVYRDLIARAPRRCLVIADGFYEWMKAEDPRRPRRPMRYTLADEEPFCFAGLWTRCRGPEGERLESFTILTCAPNPLVAPVHDRMPVILSDEAWTAWLDPGVAAADVGPLLRPLPAERMRVRAANPALNVADYDEPDCLDEPPEQLSLELA
jgi:putative SOS response-associated peptidase YedK